jgi:hypothetical protein
MDTTVLSVQKAQYGAETRIAVFIPKEPELIKKIKQLPNAYWSYTHQCWLFPYTRDNWRLFESLFSDITLNIQATTEPIQLTVRETPYPTMPLKKEYENKAVEKETKIETENADTLKALTPQETAKQRFTAVDVAAMSE